MLTFIGRRTLSAVPILIGVSIVVFITIKIIPGDPVASLLGPLGSPEARRELNARLGLNRAWPIQYFTWIEHVVEGNFGTSIAKQTSVGPLVWSAFGNTLILTAFAAIVAFVVGIALGV